MIKKIRAKTKMKRSIRKKMALKKINERTQKIKDDLEKKSREIMRTASARC